MQVGGGDERMLDSCIIASRSKRISCKNQVAAAAAGVLVLLLLAVAARDKLADPP